MHIATHPVWKRRCGATCRAAPRRAWLEGTLMRRPLQQHVETAGKLNSVDGQKFVRCCCQKRKQRRINVRRRQKNRSTCCVDWLRLSSNSYMLLMWMGLKFSDPTNPESTSNFNTVHRGCSGCISVFTINANEQYVDEDTSLLLCMQWPVWRQTPSACVRTHVWVQNLLTFVDAFTWRRKDGSLHSWHTWLTAPPRSLRCLVRTFTVIETLDYSCRLYTRQSQTADVAWYVAWWVTFSICPMNKWFSCYH